MKRLFLLPLLLLIPLNLLWLSTSPDQPSQIPDHTPTAVPAMQMPGLLTPPPTVYPPTQPDEGAQVYFYHCLVCHGDRGQGLDAWRQMLPPPDNNCWRSKCHAPNHLPDGFTFPQEVPPVIGPFALTGFQNARNLHTFLRTKMPFQQPGSLTEEEYWQLTAFLVRANGYELGSQPLDEVNAASVLLIHTTPTVPFLQRVNQSQLWIGLALVILITTFGIITARLYQKHD